MQEHGVIGEKLRQVRQKLLFRELLHCLAHSAGAAILLYVILTWAARWTQPLSFYLSSGSFVLIFLTLTAIRISRLPGPVAIARLADSQFGLDERLSAAVEAAATTGSGLIADLQQADARKYADRVEPALMVPMRLSRPAVTFGSVAVLALLITLMVPAGADGPDNRSSQPREFSQEQLSQTAEEIRRVAETLTADASEQDNDYVSAVARALEDLALQMDRGEVTRMELTESLNLIAEHLTLADRSALEYAQQLRDLGQQELAAPSAPQPEPEAQAQAQEMSEGSDLLADAPVPAYAANAGGDSDSNVAEAEQDQQIDAGAQQDSPQLLGMEDNSATARHYMEPDPEMVARLEERRQQMLAEGATPDGAVPVGAAQQSTAGEGDIGGEGAGEMSDAEQTEVDFAFDDEEIQLPTANNTEGQRVTVEASPDTVFTDTDGAVQFAFSHWLSSEEAPLEQSLIGLRQQDAVRRYFLPMDPAEQLADQKGTTQ